jgi:hypothetical protein
MTKVEYDLTQDLLTVMEADIENNEISIMGCPLTDKHDNPYKFTDNFNDLKTMGNTKLLFRPLYNEHHANDTITMLETLIIDHELNIVTEKNSKSNDATFCDEDGEEISIIHIPTLALLKSLIIYKLLSRGKKYDAFIKKALWLYHENKNKSK